MHKFNYKESRFFENMNIMKFETCGYYEIPVLSPYKYENTQFISFNYAYSEKNKNIKSIHFFIDDYQFERLWRNPISYIDIIGKFHSIMTPDFSLYTDFPKAIQIYNHYRKQWLGAFWQAMGYKVIPTVSWSDCSSYEWCFDGIPKNSTVSVASVGALKNKDSKMLFIKGFNKMIEHLTPEIVIFYGDIPKECNANIVKIKSFQEKFRKASINGW